MWNESDYLYVFHTFMWDSYLDSQSVKDVTAHILKKKIKEEKSVVGFFVRRLGRVRNLSVHCLQLQENFNQVLYLLVSKLNY